ncbi:hypothetical protein VTL71DRAFT_11466 [Oculimacula yallundae]|uniref:Uncharacterized protein n=1 Tax=Oculimacula yallundae TaxID=86028 RepID=A0ABR4CQ55_9HELO
MAGYIIILTYEMFECNALKMYSYIQHIQDASFFPLSHLLYAYPSPLEVDYAIPRCYTIAKPEIQHPSLKNAFRCKYSSTCNFRASILNPSIQIIRQVKLRKRQRLRVLDGP